MTGINDFSCPFDLSLFILFRLSGCIQGLTKKMGNPTKNWIFLFLEKQDCAKKGYQLLDSCLISGNGSATWQQSSDACNRQRARLLEIPNATYNDAYLAAKGSPFFDSDPVIDSRWLGCRLDIANPPSQRQWYHGTVRENFTWNPDFGPLTAAAGDYPLCGWIAKGKLRATWIDASCKKGEPRPYFCQYLLAEGE